MSISNYRAHGLLFLMLSIHFLEYMYEGRSICNENRSVNKKSFIFTHSLKGLFLGYINVKLQLSSS